MSDATNGKTLAELRRIAADLGLPLPPSLHLEPTAGNQEPGTENQEPRTRNREPGTENQEPRTRNCELPCP